MAASAALASVTDVQAFIDEYFGAWQGTDEDRILSYYTENVALQIPGMMSSSSNGASKPTTKGRSLAAPQPASRCRYLVARSMNSIRRIERSRRAAPISTS